MRMYIFPDVDRRQTCWKGLCLLEHHDFPLNQAPSRNSELEVSLCYFNIAMQDHPHVQWEHRLQRRISHRTGNVYRRLDTPKSTVRISCRSSVHSPKSGIIPKSVYIIWYSAYRWLNQSAIIPIAFVKMEMIKSTCKAHHLVPCLDRFQTGNAMGFSHGFLGSVPEATRIVP